MALITCENVTLGYDKKSVVKELSFSLEKGQRILVCGENGSGKSTLLRALVGLHPLTSGTLTYGEGTKYGIGYLPQKSGEGLGIPATAWEVASSGVRRRSFLGEGGKKAVEDSLSLFGADGFCKAPFSSLSGGQRQRVLLARAYLSAKEALVLDEPLTGLDPLITHELYHVIRSLSREGLGIVFVSHDVRGALSFCTHVLHLHSDGSSCFFTADQYKTSAHCAAFCKEVE